MLLVETALLLLLLQVLLDLQQPQLLLPVHLLLLQVGLLLLLVGLRLLLLLLAAAKAARHGVLTAVASYCRAGALWRRVDVPTRDLVLQVLLPVLVVC